MSNPIDDYLGSVDVSFKTAAWSQQAKDIGSNIATGVVSTGIAAGLYGAGAKLVSAINKRRDFEQMLEHDPELRRAHQEDPEKVNKTYSSLRRMAPRFAAEPIVAAQQVRTMLGEDRSMENAGGMLMQAAESHSKAFGRGSGQMEISNRGPSFKAGF